jgi:hypothetical protein
MNTDIPTIPPRSGAEDSAVLGVLASLPREQASPGFTAAVLERARTAEKPAAELGWSRMTTLLAASLVLVTVVTAGVLERAHQKKELRGRVDALRSEHEMLAHELAELKRASAEEPAVVYLGGDENVDVVLTLDPKSVSTTSPGAAVPAATSGNHGI